MTDTPVWDNGGWRALPALEGDVTADACVIGLGGSGLACVGELLRLGCNVVGIDAIAVGGGAAGCNGGFLLAGISLFHHQAAERLGHDRAAAIYRLTLAEMDRMTAETPHSIRRVGSLRIAADAAEFADCAVQVETMRADGLAAEQYSGPEGDGVLVPTDGVLQPLQRCRELALRVAAAGAQLFERSAATAIESGVVRLAHGTIRAGTIIAAVDGRLDRVFPALAPRVRTARLQMLATAPDDEVHYSRPVYRRWGYEYWQQLADGRIALGGLRDKAGDAEWTASTAVTEPVQRGLDAVLRDELKSNAAVTHRWAASVGYTDDRLPVIEEVRAGVWAIGGYSGTGNVVGAVCGRGVAQLAVRGDSTLIRELMR
ncbi:MAG: NAD(P)/FAD-dependent oxidoreductase [Gemmatimonadales bacterium]